MQNNVTKRFQIRADSGKFVYDNFKYFISFCGNLPRCEVNE